MKKYDLLIRLGVLLLLMVVILIANPNFGKVANLVNIIRQSSLLYILGIGMTMVIITRGVDLSNGAVLAFSSCIFALAVVNGVPIPVAMLVALVLGAACGVINGVLVMFARIPPFIATFAMMYVARGLAYFFMHSNSIQGFDVRFRFIGTGQILGVPMPILWAFATFLVFQILMTNTSFGVNLYAIGGNRESSRLAGINVNLSVILVYTLNGLLSAFAGLVYTARLNNAEPVIGGSFPLDTIAAVIIGGASLFGGHGTLAGTFIGVVILSTILNGMNLMGIPSLWQSFITGALIILMIAAQTFTQTLSLRRRHPKSSTRGHPVRINAE